MRKVVNVKLLLFSVFFTWSCVDSPTSGRRSDHINDAIPRQRAQNAKAKVICRTGNYRSKNLSISIIIIRSTIIHYELVLPLLILRRGWTGESEGWENQTLAKLTERRFKGTPISKLFWPPILHPRNVVEATSCKASKRWTLTISAFLKFESWLMQVHFSYVRVIYLQM